MGPAMAPNSRNRRSAHDLHLWVLALCVVGCLWVASLPRDSRRGSPEEDAVILMRAVYSRVLGVPAMTAEGTPQAR